MFGRIKLSPEILRIKGLFYYGDVMDKRIYPPNRTELKKMMREADSDGIMCMMCREKISILFLDKTKRKRKHYDNCIEHLILEEATFSLS